jgi:hypothetical protein
MRTITFTRSLLPAALATLSALTLAACAGDDGVVDELAAEDLVDQEDSKADGDGTYTYYTMSADARRCAYPFCGGIFVDRVNRSTTRCSDGSYAEACYAPELDWTESGLSQGQIDRVRGALPAGIGSPAESTVLVRGRMTARDFDVAGTTRKLGVFVVTEAWLGLTADLPDGVFVKVADAGVRCIAAPCESQSERKLNSSARAMIAGIGADDLGLTEAQSQAVVEAQFNGGAIVSGARARVTEGGRSARVRNASAIFLRELPGADAPCYVGGCSSQLCTDREAAISTCEFRPEYACYDTAVCERQATGACGWTETDELNACLTDARN